jgi:hypothetical protein
MLGSLLKMKQSPDKTWKELALRKNAPITRHKVRRRDEEWKQLLHGWNGHMDRHADTFATKVRAAAVTQSNVNCWRRTKGMCHGNAARLGTRSVLGQPRRNRDGLELLTSRT